VKKITASVLCFVMIISFQTPMFADDTSEIRRVVKRGSITGMTAPSHEPNLFRLSIDAAALSRVTIPEGRTLFLDFTVTGENTGFRIFADNRITDTGKRNYPAVERNCSKYTGHSGRLSFAADTARVSGPAVLVGKLGAAGSMTAATGSRLSKGNPSLGIAPYNANTVPDVCRDKPVAEQILQLAGGVSFWEGMFRVGTRMSLFGDRAESDTGMEHWKIIIMPVAGIDTGWGENGRGLENTDGNRSETHELSGWFDFYLPIAAPDAGSALRVRLMSAPRGTGVVSAVRDLGTFNLYRCE
jgi:hypothetical protein